MSDPVASTGPLTSSGLGLSSSETLLRNQSPARPGVPLAPTGIAAESDVRTHSPGAAAAPDNPEEPPGWEEHLGLLPLRYGDDRLVCLPRDPHCAFVYWDLSAQLVAQAFDGLLPARAVLKLFQLSGQLLREVVIDLGMRGYYLRELPAGAEFRVELWASGPNGARLLRSARPVWLPPAIPSDLLDETYLTIPLQSPLSASNLAGGRAQAWRSAATLPPSSGTVEESRIGYPGLGSSGQAPLTSSGAGRSGDKR